LRLGFLHVDDNVAASQLWLVGGDTAYIMKLAYNPEYKKLSVGTLLSAYMIEHVISMDKVATIDYLTGEDDYKKDWMGEKRTLYGIQLSNSRSLLGNFAAFINRVGTAYRASRRRLI